jgi:TolA-binding protein
MAFLRKSLLIWFLLGLGGSQLFASNREQRDFAAAASAFQDGMWSRAEVSFAQFIEKHPKSTHVPEAVLFQAEADFKQGKLQNAINLLQSYEGSAGDLADQFAYWIGMAQYQNGDYSDAAVTLGDMAGTFTNSQWRLDAIVNQAAAYARLGEWDLAIGLLQKPGFFQDTAAANATDDRVLHGRLLLAEALLSENHPDSATAVLQSAKAFQHKPEMDWQRLSLLCRARLEAGDTNAALALTTNMLEAANRANRSDLRAQSVTQRAEVLENLGRLSAAALVYGENLTNGAPDDWQRRAILKIAALSAAQTNFSDAEASLENFQSRFTNSPEADSVTLALGELHLKNYADFPGNDDDLNQAQSYFDDFIGAYTNSSLLGKAYLDRGWSFWIQAKLPESAADFQAATTLLPSSVDLAVAHFKLADAEYQLTDLTNAEQNYQIVAQSFTNYPAVGEALGAQAFYQSLLIAIQLHDVSGASNDMAQILKIYPVSNVTGPSILLVGQALSDWGQPARARALFQKFEEEFPDSGQVPDVELAIARTFEEEGNWPLAISIYDSWVGKYGNSSKLPAVAYARAWANFEGGRETNAFILFTNFLSAYPSNALTPVAQWWLGDYYYGKGDWRDAEYNYELVPQSSSPLAAQLSDPAWLMAARSAVGRQSYGDATNYLDYVIGDTNCPAPYDAEALFNYGDVLMMAPSVDANDPLANFKEAIQYFELICKQYSGSEFAGYEWVPRAWGEMGNCYYQLGAQDPQRYGDATNSYLQALVAPAATVATRSQAQIGIGMVYEKLAAQTNGVSQTQFLQAALDNYLDVFWGNDLRNGETASPLWVKEAGQRALPLIETLGVGDPNKFIDQMEAVLPQMKDFLEKKRLQIHQVPAS